MKSNLTTVLMIFCSIMLVLILIISGHIATSVDVLATRKIFFFVSMIISGMLGFLINHIVDELKGTAE